MSSERDNLSPRSSPDFDTPAHKRDRTRLEDGRGGSAAHAAGRVERVDAEELVEQAAGDAEHGGAAVLALDLRSGLPVNFVPD